MVISDCRKGNSRLTQCIQMACFVINAAVIVYQLQIFVKNPLTLFISRSWTTMISIIEYQIPVLRKSMLRRCRLVRHHAVERSRAGFPAPESIANVLFFQHLQEDSVRHLVGASFSHPERHIQFQGPFQNCGVLLHFRNVPVIMHMDAPVITFRIIIMIKQSGLRCPDRTFQRQQVILVDCPDPRDQRIIKLLQLISVHGRTGGIVQGLVEKVIPADDPSAAVSPGKFFPQKDRSVPAFLINEQVGDVIHAIVTGSTGLSAGSCMHIQDGIDPVFFAPVQYIIQHGKGVFIPADPGFFLQKSRTFQYQPDRIISKLRHCADVLFLQIRTVPSGPETFGIFCSAQFAKQLIQGPGTVQLFGLRVSTALRSGSSDHKSFRIHPVTHSPSPEDHRFSFFVYDSSSFSA